MSRLFRIVPFMLIAAMATACGSVASVAVAQTEATAWMDKICGTVVELEASTGKEPVIDTSSPKAAAAGLITYLNGFGAALDTAISGFKAAGPAPAPEGDVIITKLTEGLGATRAAVETTKANLAKVKNDPVALQKAIVPFESAMTELASLGQSMEQLESSLKLDLAAVSAPNCQKVLPKG